MKICFIALSRKRFRYFSLLSQSAPQEIYPQVIHGLLLDRHFVEALFAARLDFPSEQVRIHLCRQRRNYPALFKFALVCKAYSFMVRWWESVRLGYFERILKYGVYDAVAVWNGQKIPYSAVVLAAQRLHIPVWYFENGVLPGTTTLDPFGVNAASAVSRSPGDYPNDAMESDAESIESMPIKMHRMPTIFIPLQVDSDTQVVVHSPWVKSSFELIESILDAVDSLPFSVRIIVRNHPLAKKHHKLITRPERFVVDDETPLSGQLAASDVVVTMNSTVGLEAVALNKAVIVVGAALYGVNGVVRCVESKRQLAEALRDVLEGGWRPVKARSFVRALSDEYCIPGRWQSYTPVDQDHSWRVWRRLTEQDVFCHDARH